MTAEGRPLMCSVFDGLVAKVTFLKLFKVKFRGFYTLCQNGTRVSHQYTVVQLCILKANVVGKFSIPIRKYLVVG